MPPSRNHTRCGELTSPRRLQQQGRRNSSHAFTQLPLTTIPLIQARQSRAKSAAAHKNNPKKMRPKRSSFAITLSLSLSLSSLCVWVKMVWLVSSVWKGRRPTGQNSWAASDSDWACSVERVNGLLDRNHGLQFKGLGWGFSIKRGEKGLLDRNYGLQFIGLCWGFQCEKGVKKDYWTEFMACNSRGCDGAFQCERGN